MSLLQRFVCFACLLSFGAVAAKADIIYIGDAASQGKTLTIAGGVRADTVATLTYVSTDASNYYAAATDETIRITEVNFFADMGGTLTPFVALYNGLSNQTGANYTVLAMGDPITVTPTGIIGNDSTDHLVNTTFTVNGEYPELSLAAGDILVAGWLQSGSIVYISDLGASGTAEYIASGNALPASAGDSLTMNSTWGFDRTMQFNIGFRVIPEPSVLVMLLCLTGIGLLRRPRPGRRA